MVVCYTCTFVTVTQNRMIQISTLCPWWPGKQSGLPQISAMSMKWEVTYWGFVVFSFVNGIESSWGANGFNLHSRDLCFVPSLFTGIMQVWNIEHREKGEKKQNNNKKNPNNPRNLREKKTKWMEALVSLSLFERRLSLLPLKEVMTAFCHSNSFLWWGSWAPRALAPQDSPGVKASALRFLTITLLGYLNYSSFLNYHGQLLQVWCPLLDF